MREQDDLIDWVREDTISPWMVRNIRKAVTKGIETTIELKREWISFTGQYTSIQMDSELERDYISKYALNYLEHQLSLKIRKVLPYKIEGVVGGVFKKRVNKEGYFTLDVQLLKRISRFSLLVKGTNLLNERYEDINGVEMPGRWLTGEIKIRL